MEAEEISTGTATSFKMLAEMSVEDVQAWVSMLLSKWGSSKEVIESATNSVSTKRVDGKALLMCGGQSTQ